MRKSLVILIPLTLAVIATTPREASALSVPPAFADQYCQGRWVYNMDLGIRVCAYCQHIAGKPRCDYFVCDASYACDWIVVEKRSPRGRWTHPTPVIPRSFKS
jgi:hypothetical protein